MSQRLKVILTSDFAVAFIVAIIWQLLLTTTAILLTPDTSGTLSHMMRWDGNWYQLIINDRYASNAASPAFFPLFPFTVGFLHELTFQAISHQALALLLNTISLGFGLAALLVITRHFVTTKLRYLSLLFFLAAPAAFFMSIFYSEALFVAIAFWAYAFALQKRWLLVGILLAFLTAARLPALLFIGLCGLEYLRSYNWSIKKSFNKNLAYFLLAPLGFISYGLYLLQLRGNFLGMFAAYKATTDWAYQQFNPDILITIGRAAYQTARAIAGKREFDNDMLINHAIPLFCLALLLVSSLYLLIKVRGKGTPLGIFGLVSIVFFTINNNLVSVHRYTLPCITIYIALVLAMKHYKRLNVLFLSLAAIMAAIQIVLFLTLHTTTQFVG
ncbi:hypothetical protein HY312_01710 [Candidatus Saccharibacteria bacterium]|nr:hypothetical protein [Candidatus Saccharibacteria bacterium]